MTQYNQLDRKVSIVWFAENTQRRHSTSPYTVYDGFIHHELGKWLAGLLQPVFSGFRHIA